MKKLLIVLAATLIAVPAHAQVLTHEWFEFQLEAEQRFINETNAMAQADADLESDIQDLIDLIASRAQAAYTASVAAQEAGATEAGQNAVDDQLTLLENAATLIAGQLATTAADNDESFNELQDIANNPELPQYVRDQAQQQANDRWNEVYDDTFQSEYDTRLATSVATVRANAIAAYKAANPALTLDEATQQAWDELEPYGTFSAYTDITDGSLNYTPPVETYPSDDNGNLDGDGNVKPDDGDGKNKANRQERDSFGDSQGGSADLLQNDGTITDSVGPAGAWSEWRPAITACWIAAAEQGVSDFDDVSGRVTFNFRWSDGYVDQDNYACSYVKDQAGWRGIDIDDLRP